MSKLSALVQKFLGHPWVFEHIRPRVVGGIDMSPAYDHLQCDAESVVLDIGCGTGDALAHLSTFASYLGLDTDPTTLATASSRYAGRPGVSFACRTITPADLQQRRVTHVAMVGLLHHLSDTEAVALLRMLGACGSLVRAVSLDIVYLPKRPYNNLLARLDRGRHCRTVPGYEGLLRDTTLHLATTALVPSHPTHGLVDYFVMVLERAP